MRPARQDPELHWRQHFWEVGLHVDACELPSRVNRSFLLVECALEIVVVGESRKPIGESRPSAIDLVENDFCNSVIART